MRGEGARLASRPTPREARRLRARLRHHAKAEIGLRRARVREDVLERHLPRRGGRLLPPRRVRRRQLPGSSAKRPRRLLQPLRGSTRLFRHRCADAGHPAYARDRRRAVPRRDVHAARGRRRAGQRVSARDQRHDRESHQRDPSEHPSASLPRAHRDSADHGQGGAAPCARLRDRHRATQDARRRIARPQRRVAA